MAWPTFEKTKETKSKRQVKVNLKTRTQILSLLHDKILQRCKKKDESCKSKRCQKQGNYFEINHVSTVVNKVPLGSFFSSSVVDE